MVVQARVVDDVPVVALLGQPRRVEHVLPRAAAQRRVLLPNALHWQTPTNDCLAEHGGLVQESGGAGGGRARHGVWRELEEVADVNDDGVARDQVSLGVPPVLEPRGFG